MISPLAAFLEQHRDQRILLTDLLTEHGLLALAQVTEADDQVNFRWVGEGDDTDPVGHMLVQGFYFLPPLPLATTWRSQVAIHQLRTHLKEKKGTTVVQETLFHRFATVPLSVLLGLPDEPGLGQQVLADLAEVADRQPGRFHLSISSNQDPAELHLLSGHQPASPALTRWQAAVQLRLRAEQSALLANREDLSACTSEITIHLDEGHLRGRASLPPAPNRVPRRSWS